LLLHLGWPCRVPIMREKVGDKCGRRGTATSGAQTEYKALDAGILARPQQRPEAVVIYRLTEFRIKIG
jgi:hypothetical protein